jgi:hydrogenase maturation protease
LQNSLFKATVRIRNCTPFDPPANVSREQALMFSLASAHTILGVEGGEFISLLDPPAGYQDQATGCENVGTWPVLAGDEGSSQVMLSSPIILYDHPQIAPESAGNLFDGTEIDEILLLRIMTLTEDEKREIRQCDDHVRGVLERTENMPQEQFLKLHGVLRGVQPLKETVR